MPQSIAGVDDMSGVLAKKTAFLDLRQNSFKKQPLPELVVRLKDLLKWFYFFKKTVERYCLTDSRSNSLKYMIMVMSGQSGVERKLTKK